MDIKSLTVPIAFSPILDATDSDGHLDLVDWSCSLSGPSCLESWGHALSQSKAQLHSRGAAVGCLDGSFYLFHASPVPAPRKRNSVESSAGSHHRRSNGSRPTSPRRYGALSRSDSPSSTKSGLGIAPFQVSRPRVVSSVTTDQAEAPRNYVDFDDEAERMKDMLKGKGTREKPPSDVLSPNVDRTSGEKNQSPRLRAMSPSPSTKPLSGFTHPSPPITPLSPLDPTQSPSSLLLSCHVFPPTYGSLHAIRALKAYDSGHYLVCLHESGNISVHAMSDGSCAVSTSADSEHSSHFSHMAKRPSPALWIWKRLHLGLLGESNIFIACASSDESSGINQLADGLDDEHDEHVRLVAYAIQSGPQSDGQEMNLVKLGDWCIDGTAEGVGLSQRLDGSLLVFNVSSTRHLTLRSLSVAENVMTSQTTPKDTSSLPLPKSFKEALKALTKEHVEETDKEESPLVRLGDPVNLGGVSLQSPLLGMRSIPAGDKVRVSCWSDSELAVFEWNEGLFKNLFAQNLQGIKDIDWTNTETLNIVFTNHVDTLKIVEIDGNDDTVDGDANRQVHHLRRLKTVRSVQLPVGDFCAITSAGEVLATAVEKGRRRLVQVCPEWDAGKEAVRQVWKAQQDISVLKSALRVTCTLPIDFGLIVLGCSDGRLRRSSFLHLARKGSDRYSQASSPPLQGEIISLHIVDDDRTMERLVVGGADDGSIAVWDLQSLILRARWTIFTTPLAHVVHLKEESSGRLRGCVLCIAEDGTIAVIAVDEYQFMFLVPTSSAPLNRIHVGEDNLLLVYHDGRARLWDTKTQVFWRSMNAEKADELLKDGGWTGWNIGCSSTPSSKGVIFAPRSAVGVDSGCLVFVDLKTTIRQGSGGTAPYEALSSDRGPPISMDHLRGLLSAILTSGLSKEIDSVCREKLRLGQVNASIGYSGFGAFSLYVDQRSSVWSVSAEASASRALAITAMLQTLLRHEELSPDANTVTTFYVASLTEVIGESYKSPSLRALARYWLQSSLSEIKTASRLLFDAGIARLTDLETAEIVEHWQPYLPCVHDEANRENLRCAMALHICGSVAIEKYSLLFTNALNNIAKSIDVYLHNELSAYRALAIDLCARGFQVWQQHTDAVEMLRALFLLATNAKKEAISPHNVGSQARSAVLNIACSNTPLFMTTLTIDILQPRSVQHRRSVMQLVIFMIRKKPLVLYSNLPRLIEAVVKSLDPNSTADRDAVLDFATEILGQFVRTFPTVDFHMPTQRLAVGTSEGAVVMYDLKTATRLYVLEGHKKRTTACSFSPDGRRLVTVSLEESTALVWKVGASFTSFFMPGAPPRQGHAGSEPYKTLSFNVGDEARMSLAATLENVRFEWAGDRSVKLKIRDSTLTFST